MGQGRNDRTLLRQRQTVGQDMTNYIHQLLDSNFNRFFNAISALMMYYDADWVPEKIADSEVRIPSILYMVRLMSTERVINPATGEEQLKETELVKRAKARGKTGAALQEAASISVPNMDADEEDNEAFMRYVADLKDYKTSPRRDPLSRLEIEEAWAAPRTCPTRRAAT